MLLLLLLKIVEQVEKKENRMENRKDEKKVVGENKCIAVDSGKSATKVAIFDAQAMTVSRKKFLTKISRGYFEDDALERNTVIMGFGGQVYKIGRGAISEAEMETSKKTDIHKLCTLKAIAENIGSGKTEDVHVAIGMPVKEWKILHKRLQRIAFLSDNQLTENTELKHYSAVLVDEAHLLSSEKLQILLTQSEGEFPVIFSSVSEDVI